MKLKKFIKKIIIINHVFVTVLFKKLEIFFMKKTLKLFLKLLFFINVIINKKKIIKFIHDFAIYHIKIENNNILYKLLYNLFIKKLMIL